MHGAARLCCLALASVLGDGKLASPNSPAYDESLSSYYSIQQGSLHPTCILLPKTTSDVSDAVKVLAKNTGHASCEFAIRGGGHTSWVGASNIAGGITLDLRGLNSVDFSEDSTIVRVGAGATWDTVYQTLDPLGRTVAGGRVAGVGVGGLTLGGGISYLSPQRGWTCDTVNNFQVVLSDGTVVNANSEENTDLFFALRGGGNNFGIVTRIDFETFKQGLIWSASLVSNTSVRDASIKEFVRLSTPEHYDEHASFLLSFAYAGSLGPIIVNTLIYTKAVENPPVYENFMKLPTLQASVGLKSMTTSSIETEAMVPKGARTLYRTRTFVSNEAMLQAVYAAWNNAAATFNDIPGLSGSIVFDPIPPGFYARHATSNALGLTGRNGVTLLVALLELRWSNETDDEIVASVAKKLFENVDKSARALGTYDPFTYLNYAGPDQSPILTYGKESVQRLRAVRRRVDPVGLFTKQVPGGHKIPNI